MYYNGFTEEDLTGTNRGLGGLEALSVEHMKPVITRGILIDIAGYKGVPTLAADEVYEFLYLNLTLCIKGATESPVRPIAVRQAPEP